MKGNINSLTLIATVVSAVWLGVILVLFNVSSSYWYDYDLPTNSDAFGDMLAGIFAPLAFFWLVVGYFIQANEFRLTRQEMAEQGETLEKSARQTEIANAYRTAEAEPRFRIGVELPIFGEGKVMKNVGESVYCVTCLAPKKPECLSEITAISHRESFQTNGHLNFPSSDMVVLEFENRLGETFRRAYLQFNDYWLANYHFSEDEYHQFYRDVIDDSVSAFEVLRKKINSNKKST